MIREKIEKEIEEAKFKYKDIGLYDITIDIIYPYIVTRKMLREYKNKLKEQGYKRVRIRKEKSCDIYFGCQDYFRLSWTD